MSIYQNAFLRALIREEDGGNVAGSGGVLGSWDQSHFSGPGLYAPGDARRPFALGAMQRRSGVSKKKRKKKKKKGKKKKSTIKEYRNIFPPEPSKETKDLLKISEKVRGEGDFTGAENNILNLWKGYDSNIQKTVLVELKGLMDQHPIGVSNAEIVLHIIMLDELGGLKSKGGLPPTF